MKPQGRARLSKIWVAMVLASTMGESVFAQTLSNLKRPPASLGGPAFPQSRPTADVRVNSSQRHDLAPPYAPAIETSRSGMQPATVAERANALTDLQPPNGSRGSAPARRTRTSSWIEIAPERHSTKPSNLVISTPLIRTFNEVFGTPRTVPAAPHALSGPVRRTSPFSTVSLSIPVPLQGTVQPMGETVNTALVLPASPFASNLDNNKQETADAAGTSCLSLASLINLANMPIGSTAEGENQPALQSLLDSEHSVAPNHAVPLTPPTTVDAYPTASADSSSVVAQPAEENAYGSATGSFALIESATPPGVESSPPSLQTAPGSIVPSLIQPQPAIEVNPTDAISALAEGISDQPNPNADQSPAIAHGPEELKRPYWSDWELQPFNDPYQARLYGLDELVLQALQHSPQARSILIDPQIAQSRIDESIGVFDPKTFIDSFFHDTSDPVGNTLTTGGPPRLNEHRFEGKGGLRKRTTRGGQLEAAQQYKTLDNNSLFLVPRQQSDSKLVVSYTQPLLRGAGRAYNQSSILIARLEHGATAQDATRKLQSHVFSVTKAYWELYYGRTLLLQSKRGIQRLENLHEILVGRADLDSLRSQVYDVESALARQGAQVVTAQSAIQTAQAQLRSLVNAPEMSSAIVTEMIPSTPTLDMRLPIEHQTEIESALTFHPAIQAIRERICATQTKLRVAENDLRPTLNLVMDSYVRGLAGNYNFGSSWGDQFSEGAPSWSGGLAYERPYRNTVQKAILRIQRQEMQQILMHLEQTLLDVSTDVDSAIAQISRTYAELEAAVRSTLASEQSVEHLADRLRYSNVDNTQPILRVDELLNAQVRLIQSENAWARAQADHMIAHANLRLATGTLFTIASPEILPGPPEVAPNQLPAAP